ncbi:hypothetical protein ACROYT_G019605 [Oculina patagonica]
MRLFSDSRKIIDKIQPIKIATCFMGRDVTEQLNSLGSLNYCPRGWRMMIMNGGGKPQWFLALGWLLSCFALVGNSFIILLIASKQQLHRSTNWFLVSLSFADLGVSLSLFPSDFFCLPNKECQHVILASFQWAFLYASVANLCALTMDRYVAIVKPFKYVLLISTNRVVAVISVAWILPFIFAFVPFTFIYTEQSVAIMTKYAYVVLIVFELIPPVSLLLVTAHMLFIARKHARETDSVAKQLRYNHPATGSGSTPPVRHANRARPSVVFITSIVVFFFLCYSLTMGLGCCIYFLKRCVYPRELDLVQHLLFIANSAFNPLAYGLLKHDIKKEVKQLLRGGTADGQRSSFQLEQRHA